MRPVDEGPGREADEQREGIRSNDTGGRSQEGSRKAKDGQQQADFPTLIAWGKTAEFAEKYLFKGKKILVDGSLQTGSYEKDGVKHYTTDVLVDNIEFADSRRQDDGGDFGGNDDIPY